MSEHDSVSTGASGDASDRSAGGRRAQVNFDFAVGASVFIFAIVFAFTIAPGMFAAPSSDGQASNELRAERAAGWLTEDGHAGTTYCLVALLSTSDRCGFDESLGEELPIDGPVNVSVTRNASGNSSAKLYWDAANNEIVDSGGDYLAAGPPYTAADNVDIARQTVIVGGNETVITVRAW